MATALVRSVPGYLLCPSHHCGPNVAPKKSNFFIFQHCIWLHPARAPCLTLPSRTHQHISVSVRSSLAQDFCDSSEFVTRLPFAFFRWCDRLRT